MGSWVRWFLWVAVAVAGCGGTPVTPSPGKPQPPPPLVVTCFTAQTLRCVASLYGEGDVTALATWTAHESARGASGDPMPAPSDAVVFSPAGWVTATRAANIYVRADYVSPSWGKKTNRSAFAYGVDPAAPPVLLAGLMVNATLTDRGTFGDHSGITAEIVEGEGKGRTCVTISNGFCEVEFLRLDRPFSVRVSKPGYRSETQDRPGIALIDAGGASFPSMQSVFFSLSPQ